jgi:hypothetical protein
MSTPAEDSAAMTAAIVATIGSPQSVTPDGTVNRRCYRDSDAPYWRDV